MTELLTERICDTPASYADWLRCFEILQNRIPDEEELGLLQKGSCADFDSAGVFFQEQLVRTVNLMVNRYVAAFNRELEQCGVFNDYDNFAKPFAVLAKRLQGGLFFAELSFLPEDFRCELAASLAREGERLWKTAVQAAYRQCCDGNPFLEDQLLLIRRIRPFPRNHKIHL